MFRIGAQIKESLKYHRPAAANDAEVIRLLKLVGIPAPESRLRNYPHEMSGGMQQRVMIAMEFYAGLLAYSLVRVLMCGAGARLEGGLQPLSFSQARRVLLERLQAWGRSQRSGAGWVPSVLAEVAQHTLPKRRRPRPTELRRVRHRSLKFPPLRGDRAAARAHELTTKSL